MKILFNISILLSSISLYGQDSAALKLDYPIIRIGEQIPIHLQFYFNTIDTIPVNWPEFDNYLTNDIEIIDRSEIKTVPLDTGKFHFLQEQTLIITSFEPKSHTIPGLVFSHQDSLYFSNEALLLVNTVEIDTSKGVTDIKPIFEVDYPVTEQISDWSKENWYWFLILVLLALLIWIYFKYQNRPIEEKLEPKIIIPAHIKALEVLNKLRESSAWESDNKKQYYSNLTDAVRLYLEDRYKIQALEKTTREIIADLKYTNISVDDKYFLKEILKQADFVKFAKFKPTSDDGFIALNKSFEFVEKTKLTLTNKENTTEDVE
jgi:hypothetical protein